MTQRLIVDASSGEWKVLGQAQNKPITVNSHNFPIQQPILPTVTRREVPPYPQYVNTQPQVPSVQQPQIPDNVSKMQQSTHNKSQVQKKHTNPQPRVQDIILGEGDTKDCKTINDVYNKFGDLIKIVPEY